jgi:PIN domain nuclease of toxin-antitoxin system
LAYLQDEAGANHVEAALDAGGVCGAANWSEVAQKVSRRGAPWAGARALLLSFPLVVESVTASDAEGAAALWPELPHLSLADRLCLALARRLDSPVLTADRAWEAGDHGIVVELVR